MKKTTKPAPDAKPKPRKGAKAGSPRVRQKANPDPQVADVALTPAEEEFCRLLATGEAKSQSDAYRTVFPNSKKWANQSVAVNASQLAAEAKVKQRIAQLMDQVAEKTGIDVAKVMTEYVTRLHADPRELVEYRVSACRFCHSPNGRYQYTDGELEHAREIHQAKNDASIDRGGVSIGDFDEKGGGGYSRLLKPRSDCQECGGEGLGRVVIKDTANLSPGALALFQGVKEGKDGIEVKIGDRDAALEKLARHVNFFDADNQREVDVSVDFGALEAIYDAAMLKHKEGLAMAQDRVRRIREGKLTAAAGEGEGGHAGE
jgi:phage terminase small subunit